MFNIIPVAIDENTSTPQAISTEKGNEREQQANFTKQKSNNKDKGATKRKKSHKEHPKIPKSVAIKPQTIAPKHPHGSVDKEKGKQKADCLFHFGKTF